MYKNILHLTDLSSQHYIVCEKAVSIAKKFNANLYLLHVIELPASLQLAQGLGFAELDRPTVIEDDAIEVMQVVGESVGVPLENQYVEIGSIKIIVQEMISKLNCELIILGNHTAHYLSDFLENSVHDAADFSTCDVLTIKS